MKYKVHICTFGLHPTTYILGFILMNKALAAKHTKSTDSRQTTLPKDVVIPGRASSFLSNPTLDNIRLTLFWPEAVAPYMRCLYIFKGHVFSWMLSL